jgi:hypothetical protein
MAVTWWSRTNARVCAIDCSSLLDQRAGLAARHEAAVGHVAAVGEHFFHRREAGAARGVDHVAAGEAEEFERGVEAAHRLAERIGELGLLHRLVVELAMRLHVRELPALGLDDRGERADLVEHVGDDLVGRQMHGAAAEVLAVRKARVRADGHAMFDGPAHALAHGLGVARVPAAGDVGGAHEAQQRFVAARAFAEVGIEVDVHGEGSFFFSGPAPVQPLAGARTVYAVPGQPATARPCATCAR